MKRISFLVLLGGGLAALPAMSQTQQGSWELSVAGNFGSYSTTTELTSGGETETGEGEARGYFAMDFRIGGYVVEGLSIEPEFYFLAYETEPPAFNLGANLAYTATIPESPVKPFLIAGYGVGNGIPVLQRLSGRSSDELDIPVLRVGGGLKVFLAKQIAFKIEYRYERYSHEETFSFFNSPYTYEEISNYHNVLFGFSVFLPAAE